MKPYLIAMGLVLAAGIALSAAAPSAHAKPRVPAAAAGDGSGISDEQLRAAAYGPKVYPGAYQESLGDDVFGYLATDRDELCSDDIAAAAELAHAAAVDGLFEGQRETQKFYEFRFGQPAPATGDSLLRVHKCSYMDPDGDPFIVLPPASRAWGTYNGPLNHTALKEFGEYDWYLRHRVWWGHNLMSVSTKKTTGAATVTLYYAAVDFRWTNCDEVSLVRVQFDIDQASREVTQTIETVRTIEGNCPPAG